MDEELKILVLEDIPTDYELMEEELRDAGFRFATQRVEARGAFIKALEAYRPNIILSDYSLPSFDGLSALHIVREKCPQTPFIFVSGALGEEMAIEMLKQGATDYVLKNRLSRLGPAVSRALLEVAERNRRVSVEIALKDSEARYRTIFENTGTAMIIVSKDNLIALANSQFENLSGVSKADMEGKRNWLEFVFSEDLKAAQGHLKPNGKKAAVHAHELRVVDNKGAIVYCLVNFAFMPATKQMVLSFIDISERKQAEENLKRREQELELKSNSLEEANIALKVLLNQREEDKSVLEEKVLSNVRKLVLPYVENMKHLNLSDAQKSNVEIIENHLHEIVSPFLRNLNSEYLSLTPREIQIASLVKDGKTTKEITEALNISATAVDFHRKNIRSKLGIKNKKLNLRSYLFSLSSQE
ncbi:MAG: PAS domain S-box protein [Smithellaceae bacterium]|nr:PAS domain S-box protein [Smithellaceae bacterium]